MINIFAFILIYFFLKLISYKINLVKSEGFDCKIISDGKYIICYLSCNFLTLSITLFIYLFFL
jgi:hypothetical protein